MIQDFSGIRSFQQIDAAKQRGLAASTGADNGNNLTLVTMKINVIQNLQRTKMLFQMLDFYDAIPVSYTHLDVYKRQRLTELSARGTWCNPAEKRSDKRIAQPLPVRVVLFVTPGKNHDDLP